VAKARGCRVPLVGLGVCFSLLCFCICFLVLFIYLIYLLFIYFVSGVLVYFRCTWGVSSFFLFIIIFIYLFIKGACLSIERKEIKLSVSWKDLHLGREGSSFLSLERAHVEAIDSIQA
jgi:hypothetical protein